MNRIVFCLCLTLRICIQIHDWEKHARLQGPGLQVRDTLANAFAGNLDMQGGVLGVLIKMQRVGAQTLRVKFWAFPYSSLQLPRY